MGRPGADTTDRKGAQHHCFHGTYAGRKVTRHVQYERSIPASPASPFGESSVETINYTTTDPDLITRQRFSSQSSCPREYKISRKSVFLGEIFITKESNAKTDSGIAIRRIIGENDQLHGYRSGFNYSTDFLVNHRVLVNIISRENVFLGETFITEK